MPCFYYLPFGIGVKLRFVVRELIENDFQCAGKCLVDVFRKKVLTEALVVLNEVLSAPFKGELGSFGPGNWGR